MPTNPTLQEPPAAAWAGASADPAWFARHFGIADEDLRKVLGAALSRGGDFADLYFQHRASLSVSFEDDTVNSAQRGVDLGVGVRVVIGDQTGYAFTEELTLARMVEAARTAASIADASPGHAPVGLTTRGVPSWYDVSYDWGDVGVAEAAALLEDVNRRARAADSSIVRVTAGFVASQGHVLIVDSDGHLAADSQPMTRLSVNVVMERGGEIQSYGNSAAARAGMDFYSDERLQETVQTAVDRCAILFESGRPPAGRMPVVLAAGSSGILLHEAIGHGMEADFNRKGTSIFADRIGEDVAMPDVTIIDSALHAEQRGSINIDDEGLPGKETVLVERGVLRSYMHDRISARHYGLEPTGSGRRQSFRHVPLPRMRNTYMLPGPHSRDDIIGSVDRGIYCVSFVNGQVSIGAGDYTFYVKNGFLIEGGRLTQPIKDVNIIGNGPESLSRITMVGDDFEMDSTGWNCGKDGQSVPVSLGMPTVLVSGIVVGGAAT